MQSTNLIDYIDEQSVPLRSDQYVEESDCHFATIAFVVVFVFFGVENPLDVILVRIWRST